MKRASVVLPLVLIGLGVLFLLRNLQPDLINFSNLMRLWPFVMIAWGLIRIVELTVWANRGKTLPTRGIAEGEWFLIVVLTFVSWATVRTGEFVKNRDWVNLSGLGGLGDVFESSMNESEEFPISAEAEVGENSKIVIDSERGGIRIVGSEGTFCRVKGRHTLRANDRKDIENNRSKARLTLEKDGDRWMIRNITGVSGVRIDSDLEVMVPKSASVSFQGKASSIEANDLAGAVRIDAERGDVRVQNVGSLLARVRKSDLIRAIDVKDRVEIDGAPDEVELSDVAGAVEVVAELQSLSMRNVAKAVHFKSKRTDMRFERIEGKVELESGDLNASGIVGPVYVKANHKDVVMTDYRGSVDIDLDKGSVELRPGGVLSKTRVETSNGDVTMAVPSPGAFVLSGIVERGSVNNHFGDPLNDVCNNDDCNIKGFIGTGGPNLDLKTRRGELTIEKGALISTPSSPNSPRSPTPPKPPTPPKASTAPSGPTI
jgi:hypothetical protein